MVNKKRDRNGYRKQLGRYKLYRRDILAIENILRIYADAREMKVAGVSKPPAGRKHMPRKYTDRNIKIGRYRPFHLTFGINEFGIHYPGVDYIYDADSIKFLSSTIKRTRYLRVACDPGVFVEFRPFSTLIYAQTHYSTGLELKVMKKIISDIEVYLSKMKKSKLNLINLLDK